MAKRHGFLLKMYDTHKIHGTKGILGIFTYMNGWRLWDQLVGRYTSPMDPMGYRCVGVLGFYGTRQIIDQLFVGGRCFRKKTHTMPKTLWISSVLNIRVNHSFK